MLAPIHFRGLLHASAAPTSAADTKKTAPVASTLEALLRAACASVCDAFHDAIDRLAQLFTKPAATTASTAAPATPTPTPVPVTTTMAFTTLSTAPTMASTTPTSAPTTAPRRSPTPRPMMMADTREGIAEDFAAALVPQSIADAMRSNARPPPPPLEQLDREVLMFPASRPRHDYFAAVVAGTPAVVAPAFLSGFDDLLLPPHLAALPPAEVQDRLRDCARWPSLQASLAQARINLAVVRARGSSPQTADSSYACACGWCPNGTAAYPLCAALTLHHTMRSFGARATTSHASEAARRHSAPGHRRRTRA